MTDKIRTRTPRQAPFSLRLNFAERAQLEKQAGGMHLSAYIKSVLFAEDAPTYRKRRRPAEADQKILAEVLACLGASRISNNLNQLAKAAHTGSLIVDDDTKADIKQASEDIRAMRLLLMEALGKETSEPRPEESTSQSFTRAAANIPDAPVRTMRLRP